MDRPLNLEEDRAPALFCRIFFALSAVMLLLCVFQAFCWLLGLPVGEKLGNIVSFRRLFFRNGADCFMDFFNSARDAAQGAGAYTERGIIYPPLANFYYFIVGRLLPDAYLNTSFADRLLAQESFYMMSVAVLFQVLPALLSLYFFRVLLCGRSARTKNALSLVFLLSYAFLYLFERGNILLFAFAFLLAFAAYRDSPSRVKRELSLLALAAAAALKLYPALFGLFLLRERRFREIGRTVLYFLLLSVLPSFFFGGPRLVFGALLHNLFSFAGDRSAPASVFTGGTAFPAVWPVLAGFFGVDLVLPTSFKILLTTLPVLLFIGCFFLSENRFFGWLSLLGALLAVPGVGSEYLVIFAFVPLTCFFEEEETLPPVTRFFAFCLFLLLTVPLPLGFLPDLSLSAAIVSFLALPGVLALCLCMACRRVRAMRKESF